DLDICDAIAASLDQQPSPGITFQFSERTEHRPREEHRMSAHAAIAGTHDRFGRRAPTFRHAWYDGRFEQRLIAYGDDDRLDVASHRLHAAPKGRRQSQRPTLLLHDVRVPLAQRPSPRIGFAYDHNDAIVRL